MILKLKQKWQNWNSKSKAALDDGFSLLEVLLSVLVIGVMTAGIVQITNQWSEDEEANQVAQHLNQVREATYDFILANYNAVYDATPANATGAIEIPVGAGVAVPGHGFVIDSTTTDRLPANFSPSNPWGQVVTVLVSRPAFPAATLRAPRAMEIVIVTGGRRIDDGRLLKAASTAGGHAGYASAIDRPGTPCCTNMIQGAFGGWRILDLATGPYQNTNWFLNNTPNAAGGYLTSYLWLNQPDELGDYLYNINVAGAPEANRMFVPLEMSSNDLIGINNLEITGDINVANGARLYGMAQTGNVNLNGPGDLFAGSIFSDGVMNVTTGVAVEETATIGTLNLTGQLNANNATIANATVNNALNASDITARTISGNPAAYAQNINVNNLSVGAGNSLRTVETNVGGTLSGENIAVDSIDVGGTLNAGTINVNTPGILELTNFLGNTNVTGSFACGDCPSP